MMPELNDIILIQIFFSLLTGHEKCMFHHDLELVHRPSTREDMLPEMANSYTMLLKSLGEDPTRQVRITELSSDGIFPSS